MVVKPARKRGQLRRLAGVSSGKNSETGSVFGQQTVVWVSSSLQKKKKRRRATGERERDKMSMAAN